MLSLSIALAGASLTLIGRIFNAPSKHLLQKWMYLLGAILLCVGAAFEKDAILTAFEVIVVIGCGLALTKLRQRPIKLIIATTVLVVTVGLWLSNIDLLTFSSVGYFGLLVVAIGFGITSNRWLLVGGIIMTIYNGTNALWQHSWFSAIFFMLNLIFAIITIQQLKHRAATNHN